MTPGQASQGAPLPGDLWVGKIAGLGGLAISAAEWAGGAGWGEFDHVAGYLGTWDHHTARAMTGDAAASPGCYVAEAEPKGARFRWVCYSPAQLRDAMPAGIWSTGAFGLTDVQRAQVVAVAGGAVHQGVGYSWLDYAAIGMHRRLGLQPAWLRRFIENSHHQQCAQLWDWFYQQVAFHIFADLRWPGDVMPADIAAEIMRRLELAA